MKFISREHLYSYLNGLKYLGQGCQGICYLNPKNNIVFKIFNDYFDNEATGYTKEFLLRFSSIQNKTFVWPSNTIEVNNQIVGYTMPYKKAKNLYNINPLLINLDNLEKAIIKTEKDIKILTNNNVSLYDVRYNILYSNGKIYVIDTLDYGNSKVSYEENRMTVDDEIMLFLVDNYFDNFVNNDKILHEMYRELDVSGIEFLKVFRTKLSEHVGSEITKLGDAKKLVKRKINCVYQRGFKLKDM